MAVPYFYSEDLQKFSMGTSHPLKMERVRRAYTLLRAYEVIPQHLEVREPSVATEEDLLEIHSRAYIEAVRSLSDGAELPKYGWHGMGTGDNPVIRGMYESACGTTGASIDAAQAVIDGAPLAFNLSGGLHHAHHDSAAGFCIFNDPAAAITRLRRRYDRVAYIDIDVHHGDGVQELFYSDPSVLTVSLHQSGHTLFPGTGYVQEIGEGRGTGFSVNVPFAPDTTDAIWLDGWRRAALPIVKAFMPEAIVLQMGTDAHALDPLAALMMSAQGWAEAVRDVRDLGVPIVALGGGGYNPTTVPRMWALAATTLLGVEVSDETPRNWEDADEMPTLTDHDLPEPSARGAYRAAVFAAQTVGEVEQLLFRRWTIPPL